MLDILNTKKTKHKGKNKGKDKDKGKVISAVHRAAGAGHADIVRALIEAHTVYPALQSAECFSVFTVNGYADTDVESEDTPLHWACSGKTEKHVATIQTLISLGANVNTPNKGKDQ